MMLQQKIPIISCERINPVFFRLRFFSPRIARESNPGNFVHIRINENGFPLLRRAFSIHCLVREKGTFDVLFKVLGPGTKLLAQKRPGQELDVLGPLGNSFSTPKRPKDEIILVAGGMGIAPLFFLASDLCKDGKLDPCKISLLYGVKNKDEFLCLKDLKNLRLELVLATEDNTLGFGGMVTELLVKKLNKCSDRRKVKVFACGPPAMLKKMSEYSRKCGFECQVSLENHMPCGLGACMGCVVKCGKKDKFNYKRVCVDGPVFDAREVWLD